MEPALFLLTCANKHEADKIIQALLAKRLIACAKKIQVDSSFRWQGVVNNTKEILVLMESKNRSLKSSKQKSASSTATKLSSCF